MKLDELLNKPKLIGLVADVNTGKSMALYHIIELLKSDYKFQLYTFGLRMGFDFAREIYSLDELEQITDSVIILDETFNLFDFDSRPKRKQIEQTFRLINHNNNVLIMCLLPENCKKFLASKLDAVMFKKCTIADFINGSMTKRIVQGYCGYEKGTTVLNVPIDRMLIYNGKKFSGMHIPYYKKYDTKANNEVILKPKQNNVITKKKGGKS